MRRGIIKVLAVFALIWAIPLSVTFAQNEHSFRVCVPGDQGWAYQELSSVSDTSKQYTPVSVEYKSSDSSNQEVQICIDRKGTSIFAFWDRATEIKKFNVGESFELQANRLDYKKNYKLRICVRNMAIESFTPYVSGTVITF